MSPADGPVLVLGASGGVGSTAVGALATAGYEVHAATGKADEVLGGYDWYPPLLDAPGPPVMLPAPPGRIVSLVPSATGP